MKIRRCHLIKSHGETNGLMYLHITMSPNDNWDKIESFEIKFDDSDLVCLLNHVRQILKDRRSRLEHLEAVVK